MKDQILGTLYLYTGGNVLQRVFYVKKYIFASKEDLLKAHSDATYEKISCLELLSSFNGRKNVVKITSASDGKKEEVVYLETPTDHDVNCFEKVRYITENQHDYGMHCYWETSLSQYQYNGDKKPLWQGDYGSDFLEAYYDAFSKLNRECEETLQSTNYFFRKNFLKKVTEIEQKYNNDSSKNEVKQLNKNKSDRELS